MWSQWKPTCFQTVGRQIFHGFLVLSLRRFWRPPLIEKNPHTITVSGALCQNYYQAPKPIFSSSDTTMTTLQIVQECLLAIKDRTGSSIPAINKWIAAEKKVSQLYQCGSSWVKVLRSRSALIGDNKKK